MAKITFVEANGDQQVVEARPGQTIMEAATKSAVPGIAADCGGSLACATCRIYVPEEWMERLGEISETERGMTEFCGDENPNIRLSCQVTVTEALSGLVVHLPKSQH